MRRRAVVTGIAVAVAMPLVARAQQPLPVVGFFINGTADGYSPHSRAFLQGLAGTGFHEGRNVAIDYRWTNGQLDQIPTMAAEIIKTRPSIIVTNGGTVRSVAAATKSIPIIFVGGGDPVRNGLVASFNRPGGNVTGIVQFGGALGAKRLELLQQLLPGVAFVTLLTNPDGPTAKLVVSDVQAAAQALGLKLDLIGARNQQEIESRLTNLGSGPDRALLVSADPLFLSRRDTLASLVARSRIPAIYDFRDYAVSGGLMSYGASLTDAYRQLGTYTGRILKGERPADLPVLQPTKFEFVINLKTARALGLKIPDRLLALADEVIE